MIHGSRTLHNHACLAPMSLEFPEIIPSHPVHYLGFPLHLRFLSVHLKFQDIIRRTVTVIHNICREEASGILI